METTFNISVFTENSIGILNRITIIFTRRHLNIESITASECEVKGIYRYTIVVNTSLEQVEKVVAQIEKQVEVLKYKMRTDAFANGSTEGIIREHHARILTVDKEFMIIEKTGQPNELTQLFEELNVFGVLEFVRSGRVAISKPMKTLESYLTELEENHR